MEGVRHSVLRNPRCSSYYQRSCSTYHRPKALPGVCRSGKNNGQDIDSLLQKYAVPASGGDPKVPAASGGGAAPKPISAPSPSSSRSTSSRPLSSPTFSTSLLFSCSNGLIALLAANVAVYALAVWGGHATSVAQMVLSASGGIWWKYVTSAFVHATSAHLMRDLGIIWLAGGCVQRELSTLGLWFTYVFCAVGANLSAMWLMPVKTKAAGGLLGLGATGGAAGLILTALALSVRPSLSYVVSAALFAQLLLGPLLTSPVPGGPSAALPLPHTLWGSVMGGVRGLTHMVQGAAADPGLAWLWGCALASALVVILARFPDPEATGGASSSA